MTARCIACWSDLAPTERQCCQRCIAGVRRSLVRLERLFALLPSMLGHVSGTDPSAILGRGEDRYALPDEEVLVMLGPGSPAHTGHPSDPPAVAFELWTWAGDWCELRREDPAKVPVSVPGLVDWLSIRAGWAGEHHPAFEEFGADLRRIVARLEDVTGTSERPEKGPPCPYCRADLLREWTDAGLADDWVCARCRRAFNPPQYRLAVLASLEEERMRA